MYSNEVTLFPLVEDQQIIKLRKMQAWSGVERIKNKLISVFL